MALNAHKAQPLERGLEVIDRSQPILFRFDGRSFTAFAGDTIASALHRAGVRVLSRSFKYHRPRGLLCLSGSCPNCLVNVDGTPNVRACRTPVEAGMEVASQNAWPSLAHDVMGVFDRLDLFVPVGFYYKTFTRPRALWPAYERVLRHAAGLGSIDADPNRFQEPYYDKQYRHTDVAVVGGGPAGMSAALEAAAKGARVVLIDENPALGGHLRYQDRNLDQDALAALAPNGGHGGDLRSGREVLRHLAQAVDAHENITVLLQAIAFGWYEGHLIGVAQGNRLIKLRARQLVVATGRIEQPAIFGNNDLPGVMLGSGVLRLLNLYGVRPGTRAVVVTRNEFGWDVASRLFTNGVDVAMVLDARERIVETETVTALQAAGVAGLSGHMIQAARGTDAVEGAVAVRLGPDGDVAPGTELEVTCDLIAVSTGFTPNNALLYQSGCELRYEPEIEQFVPRAFAPGVHGAGYAVGAQSLAEILLGGRIAGLEAALHGVERTDSATDEQRAQWRRRLEALRERHRSDILVRPLATVPTGGKKRFVCLCEDVTDKEIEDAVAEGFDDIETLKRYSTVSMGPCQGKMCALNAMRLFARETARSLAETGTTTSRPPFRPVKLGVLAGRRLAPVRHSPIHRCHLDMGAQMMNAGEWKRPEHYGDPLGEVRAVRHRVGLIDVSTLGKIDVQGPDAGAFLERIYTDRFRDLGQGGIRYGMMCNEEGVLLDDGVVCRLGDQHYYVTTSTGGIGNGYEWLTWWLSAWRLRAYVTNVTSAYAAVNVAGPHARDLLRKLSTLNLSPQDFTYMHLREAELAGVPARFLRLGFVGELGYEVHYPAEYGAAVWDALLQAGAEFGAAAFGIEAQRILRLEKGHIIVGQDTDALSDPFGVGMDWAVKLDKTDFVGRSSLVRLKKRGLKERLVGFRMLEGSKPVAEGEQIVEGERFVGRVTSARYSPTLDQVIGLAWVPADKAHKDTRIALRTGGELAAAIISSTPFYDPTGERLRM